MDLRPGGDRTSIACAAREERLVNRDARSAEPERRGKFSLCAGQRGFVTLVGHMVLRTGENNYEGIDLSNPATQSPGWTPNGRDSRE